MFKTNVQTMEQSEKLVFKLLQQFPTLKINFDLEDCDKILRVENVYVPIEDIVELLISADIDCEVLV